MRSPLITHAPASSAMPSMRPSTCAGTPPPSIRAGCPAAPATPPAPGRGCRRCPTHERGQHARPGAPGDMKPRHRVAVPAWRQITSFGPPHHPERTGRPAVAATPWPRPRRSRERPLPTVWANGLRPGRTGRCRTSHSSRGRANPSPPADAAHASRPERCRPATSAPARQRLLGFLIEHDHAASGLGSLTRGGQTGQPTADHENVGLQRIVHRASCIVHRASCIVHRRRIAHGSRGVRDVLAVTLFGYGRRHV